MPHLAELKCFSRLLENSPLHFEHSASFIAPNNEVYCDVLLDQTIYGQIAKQFRLMNWWCPFIRLSTFWITFTYNFGILQSGHTVFSGFLFIGKSERSNSFQELCVCLQEIPDVKVRTAEDLLRNPARRIIARCFNNLWQQGTKYGLNVTDSDAEIPCWSVPELQGMTFKCWSKLVLIYLYTACMKN